MFKKILVPIDDSVNALCAAQFAISIAKGCGATVIGLYVARPLDLHFRGHKMNPDSTVYNSQVDTAACQANAAFALVEATAKQQRVAFHTSIVIDECPAPAIVRACRSINADLLVMGSHSCSGVKDRLPGITTQEILVRIGATPSIVLGHDAQALAQIGAK